ncbi:metal-dependent transcriptional regulator [Adhaeribacter rhizoryzae]|uniref:Transcriptional regulator MntR n=1 Tax=Adhaeribacter rhizoryzae TaxID=2607907 RepID=A0A5M6DQD5_9BACT|nr:metal-dependent transcriptional regulator [Adhaeribacter rhizoryzae]KAA5547685.1 metal-dependent transcriptional regulator [Adhaeribacter rhizoryzae]
MHSHTEENYIKTIYKLSTDGKDAVNTNAIAEVLQTKPASVSDMLKKLSSKNIIHYVKYRGVFLTPEGKKKALQIIRKHRLWEVFLVKKLNFSWDEVHEVAEQMEHIQSPLLIQRLDEYLGFPKQDPHGDPIPNEKGEIKQHQQRLAADLDINESGVVVGVKDTQPAFLQHLNKIGIYLGASLQVLDKVDYDKSLEVSIENNKSVLISAEVSKNIFISA